MGSTSDQGVHVNQSKHARLGLDNTMKIGRSLGFMFWQFWHKMTQVYPVHLLSKLSFRHWSKAHYPNPCHSPECSKRSWRDQCWDSIFWDANWVAPSSVAQLLRSPSHLKIAPPTPMTWIVRVACLFIGYWWHESLKSMSHIVLT